MALKQSDTTFETQEKFHLILDHPFIQDFIEFNKIVGGRAVAKQTIPSPNQLFNIGIRNRDIYPDY